VKQAGSICFPTISLQASGLLLKEGALFNEALAHLAPSTFVPKGVYRYSSHLAANQHAFECLSLGMGKQAAEAAIGLAAKHEKDTQDRHIIERALAVYKNQQRLTEFI
jgi:hypothetical protein